jgi:hypothetical protein
LASGTISYGFRYTNSAGQQKWLGLGLHGQITPDQARKLAKKHAGQVVAGHDPIEERRTTKAAAANMLKAICEDHLAREGGMKRDPEGNATFTGDKLRSAPQRLKVFERHLYPDKIATKPVDEIKRSEIVKLLDRVEDGSGPRMAHVLLAHRDYFRGPVNVARVRAWRSRNPGYKRHVALHWNKLLIPLTKKPDRVPAGLDSPCARRRKCKCDVRPHPSGIPGILRANSAPELIERLTAMIAIIVLPLLPGRVWPKTVFSHKFL